jgi:hypothetical protein
MTAAMLRDKLGWRRAQNAGSKSGQKNPGGGNFDDRIATRPLTQATDQEDEVR